MRQAPRSGRCVTTCPWGRSRPPTACIRARAGAGWTPPPSEWVELIKGLIDHQAWDTAIAVMLDYGAAGGSSLASSPSQARPALDPEAGTAPRGPCGCSPGSPTARSPTRSSPSGSSSPSRPIRCWRKASWSLATRCETATAFLPDSRPTGSTSPRRRSPTEAKIRSHVPLATRSLAESVLPSGPEMTTRPGTRRRKLGASLAFAEFLRHDGKPGNSTGGKGQVAGDRRLACPGEHQDRPGTGSL